MNPLARIATFVRHYRSNTSAPPRHSGHDLAQTLSDATHVRGGGAGGGGGGGGGSFASTNVAVEKVAEGAGDYAKSFKKKPK